MQLDSKPLMSSRIKITENSGQLIIEDDDVELIYEDQSASLLRKVLSLLDGTKAVSELSRVVEVDAPRLLANLMPLEEASFLLPITEPRSLAAREFLESFGHQCGYYRRELFSQPFWRRMRAGTCNPNVVLGWGIEMFHYVSAANEHMSVAVGQCRRNTSWRHWLAHHYVEEYDHDQMFLDGLKRCGFTGDNIGNAPPLPATRGLINYLYELACEDTVAYAATFGVMQNESADTTRAGIESFYGRLTQLYPFAEGIFSSFKNHALLDLDLDHQALVIERICHEASEPLSERVVKSARDAVRDVTEHFMLFFENILEYYGDNSSPIPRRKLELNMLL